MSDDALASILLEYAGLEGLGRTGIVVRGLVAEVRQLRSQLAEVTAEHLASMRTICTYEDAFENMRQAVADRENNYACVFEDVLIALIPPKPKEPVCLQCGERSPAYPGARFCGAACTARHEAHEPPKSGGAT